MNEWAGRIVRVRFGYDAAEGREDAAEGYEFTTRKITAGLALDDRAHATFSWTLPEEARDHNVNVQVLAGEEEILAQRNLAVGDAPPQMIPGEYGGPPPGLKDGGP